jgi:hypothetical protein
MHCTTASPGEDNRKPVFGDLGAEPGEEVARRGDQLVVSGQPLSARGQTRAAQARVTPAAAER